MPVSAGAMLLGSILPSQAAVSLLVPGLSGRYFDGYWDGDSNFFATRTPVFSRTDTSINFSDKMFNKDHSSSFGSLGAWGLDGTSLSDEETFSVEWTGQLAVDDTANYTFQSLSDDGIDLLINNVSVISNPAPHSPALDTGAITLSPGSYPFKFYYGEQNIHSVARLQWKLATASDSSYAVVSTLAPLPYAATAPGPLPLLGVTAAFRASRRLRARRDQPLSSSIAWDRLARA
ncbi:MAG: PA14 domain-containing protein [Synechococcaceae cyanobacterium]